MPIIRFKRPLPGEYADYYDTYAVQLAADNRDVLTILREQGLAVLAGLKSITDEQADHRYQADKGR